MFITRVPSHVYLLTVQDYRHILDKAVDDLQSLSRTCSGLVFCASVQPLQKRIDPHSSESLLYEFNYVALSKVTRQ